ncbi:MAG TPA: tetratricopeptide repeat protein, partial [Myxococcota bacterium]|nr:tetratricopeptide repeat protein [Myxococcota bacterium]
LGADPADRRARLEAEPSLRGALEAAVPRLQALAAQDLTNPWYHFTRGEYLELLGRAEEAAQAYRQALASDPAHDHELLAMAEALGRLDPALGEEAHRRGLRFLLTHGYEPELCHALLGPMLLLGRAPRGERPRGELLARARRLLDVAPRVEGAAGFYAALAASGAGEEVARFGALAEEARPYQVFGPADPAVPWTGVWLQALMAALLAVLAAGAVKTLRTLSTRFKPPVSTLARLNPMARWSRGEQLGVLAVLGLGLWCGGQAARGVALIGVQAAVPISLLEGQLQHPAARAYLEALPARPGVVFLRAFGHQQAGETVQAMELYQGLEEPGAWTNLGLLHLLQGDLAKARELLTRAQEEAPDQEEARLALGRLDRLEAKAAAPSGEAQPAPGAEGPGLAAPAWPPTGLARRLDRLERAGLEPGPLPALPTLEHWRDVWQARLEAERRAELSDPFHATLAAVAATDVDGRVVSSFWETLLWLDVAIAALALLAFLGSFTRRELESTRRGKLGWALGAALPGAARQYWLLGTPILAVLAYQVFGAWVLEMSQGASSNLLGAIALQSAPGAAGPFGASLPLLEPGLASLDWLCAHWWALLPVNLVFVIIAEKVAADPAGPFIRMRGMARATWRR